MNAMQITTFQRHIDNLSWNMLHKATMLKDVSLSLPDKADQFHLDRLISMEKDARDLIEYAELCLKIVTQYADREARKED